MLGLKELGCWSVSVADALQYKNLDDAIILLRSSLGMPLKKMIVLPTICRSQDALVLATKAMLEAGVRKTTSPTRTSLDAFALLMVTELSCAKYDCKTVSSCLWAISCKPGGSRSFKTFLRHALPFSTVVNDQTGGISMPSGLLAKTFCKIACKELSANRNSFFLMENRILDQISSCSRNSLNDPAHFFDLGSDFCVCTGSLKT